MFWYVHYRYYCNLSWFCTWFKLYQYTTNPKADVPGIIFSTIGFGAVAAFQKQGTKDETVEIETMFAIGIIFIILFAIKRIKNEITNVEFRSIKIPNIYINNNY